MHDEGSGKPANSLEEALEYVVQYWRGVWDGGQRQEVVTDQMKDSLREKRGLALGRPKRLHAGGGHILPLRQGNRSRWMGTRGREERQPTRRKPR